MAQWPDIQTQISQRLTLLRNIERLHTDEVGSGNFCYIYTENNLSVVRLNDDGHYPLPLDFFQTPNAETGKKMADDLNQSRLGMEPERAFVILASSLAAASTRKRKMPKQSVGRNRT